MKLTLPVDSAERKKYSLSRGCYAYFPAALAGVAKHSFEAGAKHTNGELVHKRWLSTDTMDCIERHLMDLRDMLAARERMSGLASLKGGSPLLLAIITEVNACAWRTLELSQRLHEELLGAPLAPAACLSDEPAISVEKLVPGHVKLMSSEEFDSALAALTPDKPCIVHTDCSGTGKYCKQPMEQK